ncbi:DUF427 domain-containing protein [Candidatus Leptofilum sp.]|uniref:DUF427 domain-containing protein n=1 Tax=Candidatus Leptofilum sp. TaxID=3241576 RepID=UPI003B5B3349
MKSQNGYHWEPTPRWIRAELNGEFVADSRRALLVWEGGGPRLHYYFPEEDVRQEFLVDTGRSGKGRMSWHVKVDNHQVNNAAWSYSQAPEGLNGIEGYVAFRWNKMDKWFEENEEVFVHPRDPYHRVDTVPSTRHIRVEVDGVTVAESERPYLLFETNLPTRYYLPAEDVNMALLEATNSQTVCPYKGVASYWSIKIGENVYKDLVWGYPDPIAEAPKIKGLLCFYNEKVDIFVDGVKEERPITAWS